MIKQLTTIFTILLLFHAASGKELPDNKDDWGKKADLSSKALIRNYWNEEKKYFNYGENGSKTEFHYWPQAHALDVLLDAYNRTNDSYYLPFIHKWYEGVPVMNGNTFLNRYIDDMEWNALAMLRAYQATGDKKFLETVNIVWEDIKKHWNDNAGGGLMWEKRDAFGKNACSNGPAAILAARLFRETRNRDDLEWAKKIYHWERNTLFDESTGAIWDNIKEKDGTLTINKRWVFTYNQGTFIGAATELFDLSNDSTYLYDAIKATDYTLKHLINQEDGLLKEEGGGDGGLFKGIFIRYFSRLIKHHALPPEIKQRYIDFLYHNADVLWNEGTDRNTTIYGAYWKKKPVGNTDLTIVLSGAMLIEAAADLDGEGLKPGMAVEEFPVWSGNPVFSGWYADPEVIIYSDRYWIYPTFSAVYEKQVHFDCFSSPDLVNWTKHENILDTAEVKWAKRAMWAPGVIQKEGKYYFFFAANDVHPGQVGGIGVAVASKPEGPYKDILGKPLISENVNGAQPIDQYVFKDKDGSYYMYYGGWRHCNMVKLNDDFTALVPFPDGSLYKEVTPEGYVEGPLMYIRDGKYYFMWSEGGWTGPNYSVAYAIADSPFGPFERIGTVLQQDRAVATGAGHHSVVNIPGTDDWYMVYHRRPLPETSAHHRVTCIDKMEFDAEGKILPVVITNKGVTPRPLNKSISSAGQGSHDKRIQLFNGENLDGWYTFLKGKGKNIDPNKVFTVKNGNIVISGEEFGCITTNEEYENYKLTVEFKWGGRTFAPRIDRARDSGILLHSVGEDGGSDGTWMHSIECQIIEGGTGDIIIVGDGTNNFTATTTVKPGPREGSFFYDPDGEVRTFTRGRIDWHSRDLKWEDKIDFRGAKDVEKPVGQWNRVECIVQGSDLLIYLNGRLVNKAYNIKPQKGKIQIQSEGAEILIRKVELERL